MSKRERTIGLLFGFSTLIVAIAPSRPQQEDPNRALATSQVSLARQALQDLTRVQRAGGSPTDPRQTLWERRLIESLRAAGAPREELIAAIEAHVRKLGEQVQFNERLFKQGQANRIVVLDAQYQALEAEAWLNQEKLR